jgi:tetratricopeptide (TPR) repeat protein/predicted Ser/Thr protein kinase
MSVPDHAYRRLQRAAREAEPPSTDQVIALMAVARGRVTGAQLEEARREQRAQQEAGRPPEPLGRILLRHGWLEEAEYQEILRVRSVARPAPALERDAMFGRYRILGELGKGGMSVVYRALDTQLRREVALKVLRFAGDPQLLERLRREAEATARLNHANIVTLHEAGAVGDVHYLAMDAVPGEPLSRRLPALPLDRRLEILEKIARAVAHAHERGVVHRDLKPGNVLVRDDGEPVVVDFGLARSLEGVSSLTATGTTVGTPLYMAPEQIDGRPAGPPADVWALGVILYEMLANRLPHQADSLAELAARIATADPAPPPGHVDVVTICMKALEKEPERRYPTARSFADDLSRFRLGEPIAARPAGLVERVARRARRQRAVLAVVAAGLLATGVAVAFWVRAAIAAARAEEASRRREAMLQDLGTRWMALSLAIKDLYQAQVPPAQTRERIAASLASLDALVDTHPDVPQARFVRARGRLAIGDRRGAEEDLARAVELEPDFKPAWTLLARTMIEHSVARRDRRAAERDLDAAVDALRRAATLPDELLSPARWGLYAAEPDDTTGVVLAAMIARYVEGDTPRATAFLEEANRARDREELCLWLARWDAPRRCEWLDRALQAMPHSAQACLERGTDRARAGDLRGGIDDLARAVDILPGLAPAHFNLALARREAGDAVRAIDDVSRAIAIDGRDAEAWFLRASLHAERGDRARALSDASRACDLDPRHEEARALRDRLRR